MIGISAKTLQRWERSDNKQDRRIESKHEPKNKLTEIERQRVIKISNESEFAHLPPCQIVPRLADKGQYIASEASFYRILNEENQLKHRDKSKPAQKVNKLKALAAIGSNQIYTWDITYLPTQVKGIFFYLYEVGNKKSNKLPLLRRQYNTFKEGDIFLGDKGFCNYFDMDNFNKRHIASVVTLARRKPFTASESLRVLSEDDLLIQWERPTRSKRSSYTVDDWKSMSKTLKLRQIKVTVNQLQPIQV